MSSWSNFYYISLAISSSIAREAGKYSHLPGNIITSKKGFCLSASYHSNLISCGSVSCTLYFIYIKQLQSPDYPCYFILLYVFSLRGLHFCPFWPCELLSCKGQHLLEAFLNYQLGQLITGYLGTPF